MKVVAALFVMVALAASYPATAYDDCYTSVEVEGRFCHEFDVSAPVPEPYADHYYLWLGWGNCIPHPVNSDCFSKPSAPGSGTPLPTGNRIGFGQFGLLFEETNGCGGLQRANSACGDGKPDNMMLV